MTLHFLQTAMSISTQDATQALHEVMLLSSRRDVRERTSCRLEGSHRLALFGSFPNPYALLCAHFLGSEWRRFGLVHPFGAYNAHLHSPNPWMFTREGRLSLNDYTLPLEGWK